ncbi:MAG: histidine kinase [Nitriliruptoraceae bacterium]
MSSLLAWSRRRPLPRALTEGGLLGVLALLAAISALMVPDPVPRSTALLAGAAPLLVLWWRRDAPIAVFLLIELLAAPSRFLIGANGPAELTVMVAIYTVASRRSLAWTIAGVTIDVVGMSLWLLLGPQSGPVGVALLGQLFAATVAALLGMYVQSRRATEQALRDRAERLDRERDLATRAAVEEERRRIARELHDVVAHHVSVMTLQAGALERRLQRPESDPTLAAIAAAIRETGQQAMSELRRLLGVLHRDRDDDGRTPQPDLSALELLVARMREAGMPLELRVDGAGHEVSAGMALAIYRITQEALTNTLRHAGPVPTTVWVEVQAREVVLRIRDRGAAAATPPHYPGEASGGHGLVGMRERAALFAGTVEAGPHPDGGFEVSVQLTRDPSGAGPRPR